MMSGCLRHSHTHSQLVPTLAASLGDTPDPKPPPTAGLKALAEALSGGADGPTGGAARSPSTASSKGRSSEGASASDLRVPRLPPLTLRMLERAHTSQQATAELRMAAEQCDGHDEICYHT